MAGKSYVVTGPLATPYQEDGTRVYLYEGAAVPDGLREGEVERMLDLGFFGEASAEAESESGSPAKSASKADWETFARSQGATDDDLEGQTKDDLIAAYGD